jgi:hypothetical protein
MATPTPKTTWSSSGPVSDGSKMYQHYDDNGNVVGQPYDNSVVRQAPDSGFGPSSPANQVKTHTAGGVLGGAHMGGHSDVAKPAAKPMPKAPIKKSK